MNHPIDQFDFDPTDTIELDGVAEDVYYVTRDHRDAFGLNQLTELPITLTAIELSAIQNMLDSAKRAMGCKNTYRWTGALAHAARQNYLNGLGLGHGLYYVNPSGFVWQLDQPNQRPDMAGTESDWVTAVIQEGHRNLARLRKAAS